MLHSPEFKALWDRIKHKTTYRVQFDNEKLIENCIDALRDAPPIAKTRCNGGRPISPSARRAWRRPSARALRRLMLDEGDIELPDVLTDLQDRTQLTRRTIYRVLVSSGRLDDFKRNPQEFIELAAEAINRCKRLAIVDGIRYQRLGDEYYYAQELFETQELTGYLKTMIDVNKSVYEQVIYQAGTEKSFAEQLETNEAIKVYAKLPGWFKVPTPLGSYNPDWAVLVEKDGAERLYFVVETKSSLFADDLRHTERGKIECAKEHFRALAVGESPARYVVVRNVDDVLGA